MKYLISFILTTVTLIGYGQIYSTIDGDVHFVSDAPLEIIEATSDQMQGVLNIERKTFAFKMYIKSFKGFNNQLQQVHFYENYMEANEYPIATFTGKLLEPLESGPKVYRAKGALNIHGQSIERIIQVQLDIAKDKVDYSSTFLVLLKDHDIELPRIVYQKIAEEIKVTVQGQLVLKQ
ncbi:MAG: hypothetical protein ACJA1A_003308 [Saprospiraceae bacterium]|jgi:hypothetical protein|tara:strand:- start:534 stop:1067 length:534 start_codon:yes stop_codon:yes gene_type:complete